MKLTEVTLPCLQPEDREQFILDNQWAFKYGAQQEFGMRDARFEEGEEVISRGEDGFCIECSADSGVFSQMDEPVTPACSGTLSDDGSEGQVHLRYHSIISIFVVEIAFPTRVRLIEIDRYDTLQNSK